MTIKNENITDELISFDELCAFLEIGRSTAYKLLNTKEIKAFKIGRIWKIPRASITEYVERKSSLTLR